MSHVSLQRCFYKYIDNFFWFIKSGTDATVTYELLLTYKNLWVEFPKEDVDATISFVRNNAQQQLINDDTLAIVRLIFKYGKESVLIVLSAR